MRTLTLTLGAILVAYCSAGALSETLWPNNEQVNRALCRFLLCNDTPLVERAEYQITGGKEEDQVTRRKEKEEDIQQAIATFRTALQQDPQDPYLWVDLGDAFLEAGRKEDARYCFGEVLVLAPRTAVLLLRVADFHFQIGENQEAFPITARILSLIPDYDSDIFKKYIGQETATLLGTAIPASRRPAQSWAAWIARNGSEDDLRKTWTWMMQNHLMDETTALDLTRTLWQRQFFRTAQELWLDWLGPSRGDYSAHELIFNRQFKDAPNGSPFDWTIPAQRSVEISRGQGLEVRFAGIENVEFNIKQFAVVSPGRYHFSAETESEDLITDQCPFFHIFDAVNPARLDITTLQIKGTTPRSETDMDFTVTPDTQVLVIQLERRESERFDNKIQGALHVYQVSLVPVDRRLK